MEDTGRLRAETVVEPGARDDDLALAARSDVDAFGMLYERHWLAVFRYLRTRTTSEADAAELTSVTFDRALAAIPRYRASGGGFVAWLLRIARNAAIDQHRRPRPRALPADVVDDRPSTDPEALALAGERTAALTASVNRLPAIQREAIALRYAAGLTSREIGHVLGRTEQATQKMLSRALASLREEYTDVR